MLVPLQRSSMFLPGAIVVVWPRRRKRPLSNTWVSRDWPFPPPSFSLGWRTFTRFPPGLMRFSPTSFLRLACWQAPGYTESREGSKINKDNKGKSQHFLCYCSISLDRNSRGSEGCSVCSSGELLFVFPPSCNNS